MKAMLITAVAALAIAGGPAAAAGKKGEAGASASSGPKAIVAKQYCIKGEPLVAPSTRILRNTCKTEQEWQRDGMEISRKQ